MSLRAHGQVPQRVAPKQFRRGVIELDTRAVSLGSGDFRDRRHQVVGKRSSGMGPAPLWRTPNKLAAASVAISMQLRSPNLRCESARAKNARVRLESIKVSAPFRIKD